MINRRRLAEYFRRNAEANERIRKLLHEDEEYDKSFTKLAVDPQSKWESKVLEVFPRRELEEADKKWARVVTSLEGDKKVITAAKNGDKSACVFIWARHVRDIVAQNFWRFLGPDPLIRRRRIENGEFYDYLSLAWGVMTFGNKDLLGDSGCIEGFKLEKYTHGTVWKQFRNQFRNYLINATKAYNNKEKLGGISGLKGSIGRGTLGKEEGILHQSYDATFDDAEAEGGMNEVGYVDDVASEYEKKEDLKEFLTTWKEFANDEDITDRSSGPSAATIFAAMISGQYRSLGDLSRVFTEKYRTKPSYIKSKFDLAARILNEYGITREAFYGAIQAYGGVKIAKILDPGSGYEEKRAEREPAGERPVPEKPSNASRSDYNKNYYARLKAEGRIPPKRPKPTN